MTAGSDGTGASGAGTAGTGATGESDGALELHTRDADGTRVIAHALAAALRPGDLLVLDGPLGAGKTTFTQGLGQGLGVRGPVASPTFVIERVPERPALPCPSPQDTAPPAPLVWHPRLGAGGTGGRGRGLSRRGAAAAGGGCSAAERVRGEQHGDTAVPGEVPAPAPGSSRPPTPRLEQRDEPGPGAHPAPQVTERRVRTHRVRLARKPVTCR